MTIKGCYLYSTLVVYFKTYRVIVFEEWKYGHYQDSKYVPAVQLLFNILVKRAIVMRCTVAVTGSA